MAFRYLWLMPILSTGFALAAFIAGYAIAVGKGVEKPWLSYISDGGAHPPESCVFGQLLNIGALFTAITVYLRHRQYVVYYKYRYNVYSGWWRTCSLILLWLGFILSFGVSMVANFQETAVPFCHFLGAMMAFFGGVIYVWGQIALSYAIVPAITPLWMNHIRVVMNSIATAALALHMVCEQAQPFVKYIDGKKPPEPTKYDGITKLNPGDPYYTNHLITTIAEWTLAIALELVVLTFAWELRNFESHMPRLYFKDEVYPVPVEGNKIVPKMSILNNGYPFQENDSASTITTTIPRPKINGQDSTYGVYERRSSDSETRRNEYVY